MLKIALIVSFLAFAPFASAETRSAQDMAKECRVALNVIQGNDKTSQGTLFTGECIGYIQGASDVSMTMKDNIPWFKVCLPDSVTTLTLIQKFITFVEKNPKYTLASTAFDLMLAQQYPCPK